MAEYRYGKEEMLALFIEDLVKPVALDHFTSIAKDKSHFPLAFVPLTEEEQVC
jgi:PERQ amino acid-rich with GYF domain-containing protein